jgi:hypothetical protein
MNLDNVYKNRHCQQMFLTLQYKDSKSKTFKVCLHDSVFLVPIDCETIIAKTHYAFSNTF